MNHPPRYLHFVLHGLEKTVVDSQLIEPALRLKREGILISLLVMEDISIWLGLIRPSARAARERRVRGLELRTLPRIPRNFLGLNTLILFFLNSGTLIGGRRLVVHARGLQGAAVWLPLRKIFSSSLRLICDVRGIEWDEYAYSQSDRGQKSLNIFQKWWCHKLESLAQSALKGSDAVFCVSRAMREALIEQTGAKQTDNWVYVPCSTTVSSFEAGRQKREEFRRAKNWSDRWVVIYSGACRDWQMPEASVRCVAALKKIEPRVFFYCLTPDVEEFQALISSQGFSSGDFLVEHRSFDQMPEALAAGDLGLLLREDTPLNRYACPTKFAEYLAAGLAVLTTDAIADIAQFVQEEHVGTILRQLDAASMETQFKSERDMIPNAAVRIHRSVEAARRGFDWASYIPTLKNWYLQLGQNL